MEGTTLTFENNSRLMLSNGNLNVIGTAQEPVVFDFVTPYWQSTTNGIVNNYGTVVLNHAKIKNAAVGYYSYSTDNDDIQNSEIFNNQWGIVMHWTHGYGTEKARSLTVTSITIQLGQSGKRDYTIKFITSNICNHNQKK
ncbi:hypothetical protein MASR2M39_07460 [Ignavibacteriales bacterium]